MSALCGLRVQGPFNTKITEAKTQRSQRIQTNSVRLFFLVDVERG